MAGSGTYFVSIRYKAGRSGVIRPRPRRGAAWETGSYGVNVGGHLKRVLFVAAGVVLLLAGAALLVLPGPGLLLVLAGLVMLSSVFPGLERHLAPVRRRAVRAAEESVSSPLRIAGSALVGAVLVGAGVVWILWPRLPLGGWPTGSGLVLSGLVLGALLVHSHRTTRGRRAAERS